MFKTLTHINNKTHKYKINIVASEDGSCSLNSTECGIQGELLLSAAVRSKFR